MDQFDDLWQRAEMSRRQVLATGAATGFVVGFALSVQPVVAETMIITDTQGLTAGLVDVPTATGPIPAYSAAPEGRKGLPMVLVVQEVFGLHEHIKDVCRRLAKLGYCAVAPSLYHRQGDVTKLQSFDQIRPIVDSVSDTQVMGDLDATLAWATAQGLADPAKVAITGFCWGGRIVWLYAAHNPSLKAGIAWYGRVAGDTTPNQPAHPIDLASRIKAPILGLYGAEDTGIPVASLDRMKAALGPDTRSQFHVYAGAPHAFFADYRPSYREAAAKDGWQRLTAWLKANGVA